MMGPTYAIRQYASTGSACKLCKQSNGGYPDCNRVVTLETHINGATMHLYYPQPRKMTTHRLEDTFLLLYTTVSILMAISPLYNP